MPQRSKLLEDAGIVSSFNYSFSVSQPASSKDVHPPSAAACPPVYPELNSSAEGKSLAPTLPIHSQVSDKNLMSSNASNTPSQTSKSLVRASTLSQASPSPAAASLTSLGMRGDDPVVSMSESSFSPRDSSALSSSLSEFSASSSIPVATMASLGLLGRPTLAGGWYGKDLNKQSSPKVPARKSIFGGYQSSEESEADYTPIGQRMTTNPLAAPGVGRKSVMMVNGVMPIRGRAGLERERNTMAQAAALRGMELESSSSSASSFNSSSSTIPIQSGASQPGRPGSVSRVAQPSMLDQSATPTMTTTPLVQRETVASFRMSTSSSSADCSPQQMMPRSTVGMMAAAAAISLSDSSVYSEQSSSSSKQTVPTTVYSRPQANNQIVISPSTSSSRTSLPPSPVKHSAPPQVPPQASSSSYDSIVLSSSNSSSSMSLVEHRPIPSPYEDSTLSGSVKNSTRGLPPKPAVSAGRIVNSLRAAKGASATPVSRISEFRAASLSSSDSPSSSY